MTDFCPENMLLDLMIVLESSSSVGDQEFDLFKKFISGLVSRFDIRPDAVKVNQTFYSS